MDEPARKRHKTASPDGGDRPSSPLKQPPRRPSLASRRSVGAGRQSSPLKEPPRRFSMSPTKVARDRSSSPLKQPPRRPSFASPTKASLSRGYPNLLPRPSSSGLAAANGHADIFARGKEARAFVMGDKDAGSRTALAAVTENGSETAAGAERLGALQTQRDVTPRKPKTKVPMADIGPEEEVELPTTPSQRALDDQYTPRPGLFSSPSKRPPRLKDPVKQSPLQKGTLAVQQDGSDVLVDEPIKQVETEAPKPQQGKVQPPDPEVEKRNREKARLARELKDLEKQVSRCTEEIAKIQGQSATHVPPPEEREELIAFINKLSKAGEQREQDKPQPISSLLCSFLPFSTRMVAPPKPEQEKPIASHRPIELDNPLPYLEMFTSFKFTTHLTLPRGRVFPSSNKVQQKHIIDITGPQNLLTATISIIIDALTNTIIDLKILRLSHWAERELGSFIRARAEESNLGNACWAIGSFWDIAKKRAEYWHRCEVTFAHLVPGRTNEDRENLNQSSNGKAQQLSRRELNRHLGRDTLVLEDKHVLLKIRWKIGFDWTGEAESAVSVVPAVPEVWLEADSNGSLKKIPETFDSILQSKGAFAAIKTMVALLFSE